jgi:hypothetical protein
MIEYCQFCNEPSPPKELKAIQERYQIDGITLWENPKISCENCRNKRAGRFRYYTRGLQMIDRGL